MSTKIYDGLCIDSVPSLHEMGTLCNELREIVGKEVRDLIFSEVVRQAVLEIDHDRFLGNKPRFRYLMSAIDGVRKESKKAEARDELAFSQYDFGCNLSIFPTAEKTLFICFAARSELFSAVLSHPLIRDFHYQNQTDPPEDVSKKEWKQRRDLWNSVLVDKRLAPCETGLSADLSPPRWKIFGEVTMASTEQLEGYIPSDDLRSSALAEHVYRIPKDVRGTHNTAADVVRYLMGDEYKSAITKLKEDIAAGLKPISGSELKSWK